VSPSTAPLPTPRVSAAAFAALSLEEINDEVARWATMKAAADGHLAALASEVDRRQIWEVAGASSLAAWLSERIGISERSGRALAEVAERLGDLPQLASAFQSGEISLDKVAVVVGFADPSSDAALSEEAKACSVRELRDVARRHRGVAPKDDEAAHEGRHLRFNDARRTISGRLPEEDYALVKHSIDEGVTAAGSDGETPLDQRRADALVRLCATPGTVGGTGVGGTTTGPPSSRTGGYLVVVHVDYEAWRAPEGTGVAELERSGLISAATARRIACAADIAVAFDDEDGHTMFEGRAKRYASATQRHEVWRRDRRCRFPGCGHIKFMIVHHLKEWEHGGLTDLSNLVWLCEYHHHRVHRLGWRVLGDANGELTFIGPDGRAMTSRPSPLWTKGTRAKSRSG
jgi:hypothetical protein